MFKLMEVCAVMGGRADYSTLAPGAGAALDGFDTSQVDGTEA